MPFFWHDYIWKNYIFIRHKKPSLRAEMSEPLTHIALVRFCRIFKKRVSSFIFRGCVKASMTIEAALVLPVFLFASFTLISTLDIMRIKGCMDVAVAEAGNELAIEQYGVDIGGLIEPFYVRHKIKSFLEDNLSEGDLDKLADMIWVTDISFLKDEHIISFRVDYNVIPGFGLGGFTKVKLHTTYYGRSWVGYKGEESTEEMVFMSNFASVYHLDKHCSHLNVTIEKISYSALEGSRNSDGAKYQSCSFCNQLGNRGIVFITPEGRNYHNVENCIGLTRSIYTVPLSAVSHKRVCSRCGG